MAASSPGENQVFADERQARIAELVATRGRVRIAELTELFGVTEPTLRKDLTVLQERGLLKRTYGGALAMLPVVDREFAGREEANRAGKQAIARACLDLLRDGDSVFLDSGTTVDALARSLAARNRQGAGPQLSVLTNTLHVAQALADVPGIDCVLLGGQLQRLEGSVIGPLAIDNLRRFSFSVAFLGVSGFSESGISVGSIGEAAVKGAVIERARRVVVPLDHSKAGTSDFARIADLDAVDVVVTDEPVVAVAELCDGHGIELVSAGV
jgi:DeoR/GlpR family transcriptional regulator of sugar metabolism